MLTVDLYSMTVGFSQQSCTAKLTLGFSKVCSSCFIIIIISLLNDMCGSVV